MNFANALEWAKQGKRIALMEWFVEDPSTGKEPTRWVVLMPALDLPPYSSDQIPRVNERTARHIGENAPLRSQPYFAMFDRGLWRPGWMPTVAEMLSEGWCVLVPFLLASRENLLPTTTEGEVLDELEKFDQGFDRING